MLSSKCFQKQHFRLLSAVRMMMVMIEVTPKTGEPFADYPQTQDRVMVFVHVTTTTINNAPVEDLILDAAKETPTTLKLSHNAGKYVKTTETENRPNIVKRGQRTRNLILTE